MTLYVVDSRSDTRYVAHTIRLERKLFSGEERGRKNRES